MSSGDSFSRTQAVIRGGAVCATMVLAALVLLRFHVFMGYPFGDSTQFNVPWSVAFIEQIRSGEWYPRWLWSYPRNIGSPVFYFYGPLPFYGLALIKAVLPVLSPTQLLTVLHGLLYGFSGLAFYIWARRHASAGASLVGACLYMGAPYHFLDLELRNAIGEAMAFIFVPLIFRYLLDRHTRGRSWLLASLFYAALITSHLPSALLTTPFMALATAVVYKDQPMRGLVRLSATGLCGALLAGPYLLPALSLRDWLPSDAWLSEPNTLPETWLLPAGFFFRAGGLFYGSILSVIALAALLQVGLFLWRRHRREETRSSRIAIAAWLGIAVCIVMFSAPSIWLWTHVAPLRNVQFPFRLGVITDFLSVTLIALALDRLATLARATVNGIWLAAVFLVMFITSGLLSPPGLERVNARRMAVVNEKPLECCVQASEYWMGSVLHSQIFAKLKTRAAFQSAAAAFAALTPERTLGPEEALSERQAAGRLLIDAQLSQPTEVRIGQAYLPEWQMTADGAGEAISLRNDPETGLILAMLPAGSHRFALFIPQTPAEWWGRWAGLAGLALLALMAVFGRGLPVTAGDAARAGS